MDIISTMSLAGTIALVFYYFVKLTFREKHSAYWKMILLKISIFFYLCPFQLIKYLFPEDIVSYLPEGLYRNDIGSASHFGQAGYLTTRNLLGEYVSYPAWKAALAIIWMGLVFLFITYELVQYFRIKYLIVKCSDKVDVTRIFPDTDEMGKCRGRKGHPVQVLSSAINTSPFTIGVIRPIIFIPDVDLDGDEFGMIYQHEMTHIRNHDVFIKFLCLVIVLLHWFNPFSYLVLYEFHILSEYCCDESVMNMRGMEDRKKYAILIVRFATRGKKNCPESFWKKCFSGDKKQLEKRIGEILEKEKKKSWIVILAAVMSVLLGAMTVYAYKAETVVGMDDAGAAVGELSFDYAGSEPYPDFSMSNNVFISEDGAGCDTSDQAEPYVLCTHIYKAGYCYNHIRNDNGGCSIKKYNAQQCQKCGKILVGTLISTEIFVKCTH